MEYGRLGMKADWGLFLVGKVMEQGGMGETQRLEGRKGLGPNLVLILVLILVETLVLDVVLVLLLFLHLVVVVGLVSIQVLDSGSGSGCKTGAQGVT